MPHFLRASSTTKKIVFPLAFGAFALVAVHAGAQQASPPPGPPSATGDLAKPGGGPDGARPDDSRNRPRFSEEDRTAFFNARLASIRAGLMLTPDQDKMWPPVEAAVRDLIKLRGEQRAQFQAQRQAQSQSSGQSQDPAQAQQSNPLERLRLRGEAQMKHGEAVKKFAEAALPLYSSLNDDQKRRLRFLGRGLGQGMMGQGMQQQGMQQNDRRGPNDRGYDGRGERRWRDMDQRRGGYRGRDDDDRDDRRGYGDRRGSNDFQGYRQRSRQDSQDSSDGFDRGNGIEDWRDRF
ncbi:MULTISPECIES: Spy/CpxP family protein refolding chaperone [unclassified Beijerinckia]|uniref:Spy/CpxP family protein refolding chaperone n=1 Tax=unclassified Beijerinckia TaxID=2638183 RepID=UPI00089CFA89|nr:MULTISPECIES: Spy/CpxP family protein refolding chaperone [unclassified Beijerinckia]MDH7797878.1 hypothetical protein [Beijerinckia sp. GAS462]SED01512.1 LTXXQ motif family protein [Beijerinckia sp. 28-YEA-48]